MSSHVRFLLACNTSATTPAAIGLHWHKLYMYIRRAVEQWQEEEEEAGYQDAEVPPNFSVHPVRSMVAIPGPRRPDDGVTASMHAPGSLPTNTVTYWRLQLAQSSQGGGGGWGRGGYL
jgi:hypothetical protein